MALSLLTFVFAQWEFDIPLVIRFTAHCVFLTCTDRTGDVDKSIIENQTMLSWERLFLITHGGAFSISEILMFALANNKKKKAASHELIKLVIYVYQIVAGFLVFRAELFLFRWSFSMTTP